MTCDSTHCTGYARWRPTFLIYTALDADPLEAEMEMSICDACLKRLALKDFITDENWQSIREALIMKGYPPPARDRTMLDWQLIEEKTLQ